MENTGLRSTGSTALIAFLAASALTVRTAFKHFLERGLVGSGLPRLGRLRHAHDVLILAYHNIVPDGAPPGGDQSLHLPQVSFGRQLDELRGSHDIVSLSDALAQTDRQPARPRAVITFDDAYAGAVTAGARELLVRSLPAVVFVSPAFVGGESFWWDAISETIAAAPSIRHEALTRLRGKDRDIRRLWAQDPQRKALPPHMCCATEEQLFALENTPLVSIGSHSWSHPNLAAIEHDELVVELQRSLTWLRERFSRTLPILSYPYGLYTPAVERVARELGYRAGLRIDGGWWRTEQSTGFSLPRLNIPSGVSSEGFALRIAGLL